MSFIYATHGNNEITTTATSSPFETDVKTGLQQSDKFIGIAISDDSIYSCNLKTGSPNNTSIQKISLSVTEGLTKTEHVTISNTNVNAFGLTYFKINSIPFLFQCYKITDPEDELKIKNGIRQIKLDQYGEPMNSQIAEIWFVATYDDITPVGETPPTSGKIYINSYGFDGNDHCYVCLGYISDDETDVRTAVVCGTYGSNSFSRTNMSQLTNDNVMFDYLPYGMHVYNFNTVYVTLMYKPTYRLYVQLFAHSVLENNTHQFTHAGNRLYLINPANYVANSTIDNSLVPYTTFNEYSQVVGITHLDTSLYVADKYYHPNGMFGVHKYGINVGTGALSYSLFIPISNVGIRDVKISNFDIVCFLKGTRISTKNGFEYIENLKSGDKIVNINGIEKTIKHVVIQNIDKNFEMILFKKHVFSNLSPCNDLYITTTHQIIFNDSSVMAKNISYGIPTTQYVEKIYNIWLEEGYDFILANNMQCETFCAEAHKNMMLNNTLV